jgi:hypothetical protein
MKEKQQIDNIRRSLITKIGTAVEKQNGCIGTFYKNLGERHTDCQTEEEYGDSPIVVTHNADISAYGNYEAATLYDLSVDTSDGRLKCTLNGEAGEDWDEPVENIQTEGLLKIVEWLTEEGFIPKDDPYRCKKCGSLDVEVKVWVDSNTSNITDEENVERNDRYCNYCGEHTRQVQQSELMEEIDDWFANHLCPDDDEVISGLNCGDFATVEEFEAACKGEWDARSVEEKIYIWYELTRDKSNDN